eukprot:1061942-Rhodomonas_salina.5
MSSTDLGYDATRCPALTYGMLLRTCYAVSDTELAYAATRGTLNVALSTQLLPKSAIFLHVCYAVSGTDTAKSAIFLHVCYAVSGTDTATCATTYN